MTKIAEHSDPGFSQSNSRAMRNPWVVGWIALVVIVLSVNIVMISLAFLTNPGLVVEDYYERGQDYEKTINSRIAARNALGWDLSLEVESKPVVGRPAQFRLAAADKVGVPLRGGHVRVHAYRPSDAKADFEAVLEEGAAGQYEGEITFPLKGIWDLQLTVLHGDDQYDVGRRISVRAN
jgi:nitrogen fixation protein FixH